VIAALLQLMSMLSANAQPGNGPEPLPATGTHRAGDHPTVVVQRLNAQRGYDYLNTFYPHPAWLYLLPEAPRPMADHPAVVVFQREQQRQAAQAKTAEGRDALLAEQREPN
jgi:hypothetical protein